MVFFEESDRLRNMDREKGLGATEKVVEEFWRARIKVELDVGVGLESGLLARQ